MSNQAHALDTKSQLRHPTMSGKTALYCRVSTSDQSLARQRQQTSEYATDQLGIEPAMIDVYSDKQTGTNTDRDGYLDMGIDLDPKNPDHYTRAFLSVAATFAELEAEIKRDNIREGIAASRAQGKWHSRPPFGFDIGSEGYLIPNEDYDTAVVILDELDKGTIKCELARRAGITRTTVRVIDKNRERYIQDSAEAAVER